LLLGHAFVQLTEVERFHEHCPVHTEVKPDNVLVESGSEANKLFLIDLGLAASKSPAESV